MAEYFSRQETVSLSMGQIFEKIINNNYWYLLFNNEGDTQAEILLLSGMFSGAGFLGFFTHGARRSVIFVKLIKQGNSTTEVKSNYGRN
ncbi:MAG: hypothetical protein CVT90_02180 [Candidatus Altiarchaeales archaeon HGW-Altiarchaeales-3]|nr:MAG: hypothetical protein CVT90_02180 [Candidatus Altiarchaeales archaeon HGW-Altiarchaeales-3]